MPGGNCQCHGRDADKEEQLPAVTSEPVQWTFEYGLFAGCHVNMVAHSRRKENVLGDTIQHLAGIGNDVRLSLVTKARGRAVTEPFRDRFVAGRQERVASWLADDIPALRWRHYVSWQAQRRASASS